ncbi:hypothetical protein [Reichenbachiella versicolor]|uniref:hypothetical protein n=1 Tax=Reichenbachiella versicolor TaxID=1821036 RepID=UPI0013A58C5F|nr:hypothetical protein [Reichenbachiella versicolor]
MLKEADFSFINWAIRKINIVDLNRCFKPTYLCFTGTNDLLVSNWGKKGYYEIVGGKHFSVFDHAE